MKTRGVPIAAAACLTALLAACGTTRIVTRTRTVGRAATLTPREAKRVNGSIRTFNTAAAAHDFHKAGGDATREAALLTKLAAQHAGTPLAHRLARASSGWTALAGVIHRDDLDKLSAAEARVQKLQASINDANG